MSTLLGFKLDVWDYVAFAAIFALVAAGLTVAVFVSACRAASRLLVSTQRRRR